MHRVCLGGRLCDRSAARGSMGAWEVRLVRACRTAGSPTAWRPKKTQRAGARRCGKTFTSTAASWSATSGQARRPAAAGRPHFARPEAQASGSPALAGRRPASPETPARRRQREQRPQSRMSACGRGNFRAPAQKSCGQLPARMSFCSLLQQARVRSIFCSQPAKVKLR